MKADTKILVIGRSGCGKDTFAHKMIKDCGLKQLISTTTRPMRYPGEDTHVFVTEEEAATMTERVAETVIDGYQYFATQQQLDESDIYIIDPKGLYDVCKNSPNTNICVVFVYASDEVRRNRAIWRAADQELAAKVFESRTKSEDAQFKEFENMLFNEDICMFRMKYPSVTNIIVVDNDKADVNKVYDSAEKVYKLLNAQTLRKYTPYSPMYYEM